MKMCGDCIYYPICGQWVEESETFPEIEGGCKVFKSKADFVEVVRCKNCEHWHYTGKGLMDDRVGICGNDDFPFHCEQRPITRETDFCSYGERRKENVFCQEKEV